MYLIARGKGMHQRQVDQAQADAGAPGGATSSRWPASGGSAADQIASAKGLLDAGTITQAEFDALKAKALAG